MNLVDYGSSDSENEDETNTYLSQGSVVVQSQPNNEPKINLPVPKVTQSVNDHHEEDLVDKIVDFNLVPQPKTKSVLISEEESLPLPKKVDYGEIPKPPKNQKGKTRILIPSMSEFKNLEEEENENYTTKPSSKKSSCASKLLGALPPPKNSVVTTKPSSMIPHVLTKKNEVKKVNTTKPVIQKSVSQIKIDSAKPTTSLTTNSTKSTSSLLKSSLNYSDSEDEDDQSSSGMDFFSLSTPTKIPDELLVPIDNFDIESTTASVASSFQSAKPSSLHETNKTLTSTVMNLPKEEILLKNKIEVGPKLPLPEQEYNVDNQGNLAFDEKAIEYLCGRRGVKRKNEFDKVEILDINGEDMKPDERDWLVKALTEEQVVRPVSANAGPSGQSKKKHQITYLAHQAKSMELELKNQWAQSNHNRQQSRSKYGF